MILRSLPPSYSDFVESYVMRGESVELPAFLEMVRDVQVETIEVIHVTGIFDIQIVINIFHKHLLKLEYMILISVL